MADRSVTHATQDNSGNTAYLGNPGYSWSPRPARDVIADIDSGAHTYHVPWQTGRTDIHVVTGTHGRYLRTDRDNTTRNNLDELPNI